MESARKYETPRETPYRDIPDSEPRPLPDEHLQLKMRKELSDFLMLTIPDLTLEEGLQGPSAKDFLSILSALMQRIDPLYQLIGRIEDEVPIFSKH